MSQEVGFSVDSGALEASLLQVSGTNYGLLFLLLGQY